MRIKDDRNREKIFVPFRRFPFAKIIKGGGHSNLSHVIKGLLGGNRGYVGKVVGKK